CRHGDCSGYLRQHRAAQAARLSPGGYARAHRLHERPLARRDADGTTKPGGRSSMRAVAQRVSRCRVLVEDKVVGEIGTGLLVLLGISKTDTEAAADYLAEKTLGLRIFEDAEGKMNLSVEDKRGEVLVVSQFTLYGDVRRGKRPSFDAAARPAEAKRLYEYFVAKVRAAGVRCETGVFQAMMDVELVNAGPVTILLDSEKLF